MSDMAEEAIFQNHNILPAQFFSGRPDRARMEPLERLSQFWGMPSAFFRPTSTLNNQTADVSSMKLMNGCLAGKARVRSLLKTSATSSTSTRRG